MESPLNAPRKKVKYTRPSLAQYQTDIIDCTQRFACIEASTKAGKTTLCIIWLFEETLKLKKGEKTLWVAPVYAQAKVAYDRVKSKLTDNNTQNDSFIDCNDSRLTITLRTGGIICFKSADNPDSLYGDDYYAAVIDEASRCKEDAWIAVRSTLTATRGKCKLIGNVKGRKNFFYKMCIRAKVKPDMYYYRKITAYDAVEAGILDMDEIENARMELPESVFKELYLAEASEDGSNPFGINHIAGCVAPMSMKPAVCYGVDLAKSVDFTAITGLDKLASVCDFRMFQKDWEITTTEVIELPGVPVTLDSTGAGDPIFERVAKGRNSDVEGYVFTSKSKQKLMEGLAVAIQKRLVTFPDGPLRDQLDSFEYHYTRTGVRYGAPDGEHDDAVCSLALAWHRWQNTAPDADGPSISFG